MYQKRRIHTSYTILINDLIAGVAVALYGEGLLTCEIVLYSNPTNAQLKGSYDTYMAEITRSDNEGQAIKLLTILVDSAIINRADVNVAFQVNRDVFKINFNEFSEQVTLVNDFTKFGNKKHAYISGGKHYDFKITQSDEEAIEYLMQHELSK